jgi:hypothetical protein
MLENNNDNESKELEKFQDDIKSLNDISFGDISNWDTSGIIVVHEHPQLMELIKSIRKDLGYDDLDKWYNHELAYLGFLIIAEIVTYFVLRILGIC